MLLRMRCYVRDTGESKRDEMSGWQIWQTHVARDLKRRQVFYALTDLTDKRIDNTQRNLVWRVLMVSCKVNDGVGVGVAQVASVSWDDGWVLMPSRFQD